MDAGQVPTIDDGMIALPRYTRPMDLSSEVFTVVVEIPKGSARARLDTR
jgi:hypothetical protein